MQVIGLGAGGHARVLLDMLRMDQKYEIVGLLDPDPLLKNQMVDGVPILGGDEWLALAYSRGIRHFFVGVGSAGSTKKRVALYSEAVKNGLSPISIIHPSAVISPRVSIDVGATIMARVVVNPGAVIGINVTLNTGSIVEHDCRVGNHVHIATAGVLCGGVDVGAGAHVGAGSVIRQYIRIGENAVVGAGAVVVRDVPPGVTVAGVPAKPLKQNTRLAP